MGRSRTDDGDWDRVVKSDFDSGLIQLLADLRWRWLMNQRRQTGFVQDAVASKGNIAPARISRLIHRAPLPNTGLPTLMSQDDYTRINFGRMVLGIEQCALLQPNEQQGKSAFPAAGAVYALNGLARRQAKKRNEPAPPLIGTHHYFCLRELGGSEQWQIEFAVAKSAQGGAPAEKRKYAEAFEKEARRIHQASLDRAIDMEPFVLIDCTEVVEERNEMPEPRLPAPRLLPLRPTVANLLEFSKAWIPHWKDVVYAMGRDFRDLLGVQS